MYEGEIYMPIQLLLPVADPVHRLSGTKPSTRGGDSGKAFYERKGPLTGSWIKDTSCEPVYLTAHIIGRKQRFKQEINFQCGE